MLVGKRTITAAFLLIIRQINNEYKLYGCFCGLLGYSGFHQDLFSFWYQLETFKKDQVGSKYQTYLLNFASSMDVKLFPIIQSFFNEIECLSLFMTLHVKNMSLINQSALLHLIWCQYMLKHLRSPEGV